jgi:hypothetical protein
MKPDEGSKRKHSDDDDVHLLHLRHDKPTRETTACMERDKKKMDALHAPGHVPHLQQLPVSCHHPFCHRHELPEEIEKTRERSPASPSKEFRRFAVTY